ncbi:MAG: hypothetical protein AABY22_30780, partial [Nanoarchaeota archaeon]
MTVDTILTFTRTCTWMNEYPFICFAVVWFIFAYFIPVLILSTTIKAGNVKSISDSWRHPIGKLSVYTGLMINICIYLINCVYSPDLQALMWIGIILIIIITIFNPPPPDDEENEETCISNATGHKIHYSMAFFLFNY